MIPTDYDPTILTEKAAVHEAERGGRSYYMAAKLARFYTSNVIQARYRPVTDYDPDTLLVTGIDDASREVTGNWLLSRNGEVVQLDVTSTLTPEVHRWQGWYAVDEHEHNPRPESAPELQVPVRTWWVYDEDGDLVESVDARSAYEALSHFSYSTAAWFAIPEPYGVSRP